MDSAATPLTVTDTGGLGAVRVTLPAGRSLTPAGRLTARTIGRHRELLAGVGIDWGCGSGLLAITASRIEKVTQVVALEIEPELVEAAVSNVEANEAPSVTVLPADSFEPFNEGDRGVLAALEGAAGFCVANPPASRGDDGLGWRRRVLADARRYLRAGAAVFLQISHQYGPDRTAGLAADVPGYRYEHLLEATEWEPFDLGRPDLLAALGDYAAEEQRGGLPYRFRNPGTGAPMTAAAALDAHERAGVSPHTQWQVHLFRHEG